MLAADQPERARADAIAGMAHHAAAARYRRGQVLGGDAGRALVGEARAELGACGIVDPERVVNMLAPRPQRTAY